MRKEQRAPAMPGALFSCMIEFFLLYVQKIIDLVQLEYFQWVFMGFVGLFAVLLIHRMIWGH